MLFEIQYISLILIEYNELIELIVCECFFFGYASFLWKCGK